jgi:hypothetical protein
MHKLCNAKRFEPVLPFRSPLYRATTDFFYRLIDFHAHLSANFTDIFNTKIFAVHASAC